MFPFLPWNLEPSAYLPAWSSWIRFHFPMANWYRFWHFQPSLNTLPLIPHCRLNYLPNRCLAPHPSIGDLVRPSYRIGYRRSGEPNIFDKFATITRPIGRSVGRRRCLRATDLWSGGISALRPDPKLMPRMGTQTCIHQNIVQHSKFEKTDLPTTELGTTS